MTTPSLVRPNPFDDETVIVPWNEVYANLGALKTAVMQAAAADPVCQDLAAQAMRRFGIDPLGQQAGGPGFVNQVTRDKIIDDVFNYWAHPLIGNLLQSPGPRPTTLDPGRQGLLNWATCGVLDAIAKAKILELLAGPNALPGLRRSRRDQVRICANIVELARAIVGEIAAAGSRRLEKVLALQLCLSPALAQTLGGLIRRLTVDIRPQWFRALPDGGPFWMRCEYMRYYLGSAPQLSNSTAASWALLEQLLADVTGANGYRPTTTAPASAQATLTQCLTTWRLLPLPMRCVAMANDLRKLAEYTRAFPQVSLGNGQIARSFPLGGDPGYSILNAAAKTLVTLPAMGRSANPTLETKKWGFGWSWNRDEYAATTLTYRYYLCPLWAGPSNHTTGALRFWTEEADGLSSDEVCALTSGLFAFWRLYYDKRISANHTLTETFEATASSDLISPVAWDNLTYLPNVAAPPAATTGFELVTTCWAGRQFVDPIVILRWLAARYVDGQATRQAAYDGLQQQIDAMRAQLVAGGFAVPRWSDDLAGQQGVRVPSFAAAQAAQPPVLQTVQARPGGTSLADAVNKKAA